MYQQHDQLPAPPKKGGRYENVGRIDERIRKGGVVSAILYVGKK